MPLHVGLIRAIGPATHRVMRMAALAEACAAAGLEEVRTIGNTGNIVCRSRRGGSAVRQLMQQAVASFGLDNEVFVRTPAEMAEVVAANPFPEVAAERPAELGVCSFHLAPDWDPILQGRDGPEGLAVVGAHLIVAYPAGISTTKLRIEKQLGATMTQRNWTVYARLAGLVAA